jgi:hypothetical protein
MPAAAVVALANLPDAGSRLWFLAWADCAGFFFADGIFPTPANAATLGG